MCRWIRYKASKPTGTLTKKISRHDNQCTISPPTVGPSSGPIKAGMMTKFIALSSSDLGKVRMMARRPTGIIMAASMGAFTAKPHNTEATVKVPTATMNTRRVPKRSAIQPLMGMHTASARM